MELDYGLLSTNTAKKIESLTEVENLKYELAKQSILCPTSIIEKAIVFENGRDMN